MSTRPPSKTKRRKRRDDDDEDYDGGPESTVSPPMRSTKRQSRETYNHRLHDPSIARHGVAERGTFRYLILSQVAIGTKIILWLHKARSPLVDAYFIIMSFLGDQILYVLLFPWFLWVIDPKFGRVWLLLLVTGTTLGNLLKNTFAMPRPPSPPLWTHHKHEDFGMPSTHTMNSVTMSLFLCWWAWPSVPKDGTQYLLILFVIWYTSSMFVSRMYLAAHSHVDTISGFTLGLFYFWFWINFHSAVDDFLNTNYYAPLYISAGIFILLLFHPRSSRPSPSFRYSMSLTGLALGISIGVHLSRFHGAFWLAPIKTMFTHTFRDSILHSISSEWHAFTASALGVTIGISILVFMYALSRFGSLIFLLIILRIPPISTGIHYFKVLMRYCALPHPLALDNLDHPQWDPKREVVNPKDAKMLSDMIGTTVVGLFIAHGVPVILNRMGLMSTSLLLK